MIYTSYWAKLKKIPREITPYSICLYPPKGHEWKYLYSLIPDENLFRRHKNSIISIKEFLEEYYAQIRNLPIDGFKTLNNCVLLCYEKNSENCHRSVVNFWLNDHGITCKEFDENA